MTKITGTGVPHLPTAAQPAPSAPAAPAGAAKAGASGASNQAAAAAPQDTFERAGQAAAGRSSGPGGGDVFERAGSPVKVGRPSTAAPPKGLPAERKAVDDGVWEAMKDAGQTALDVASKTVPQVVGAATGVAVPKELEQIHEKLHQMRMDVIKNMRG